MIKRFGQRWSGLRQAAGQNVELDILSIHYQNSMLVDTKPLIERC
jgi:hypothetical protein